MLSNEELIALLFRVLQERNIKRFRFASEIGVAPETVSRWKKSGRLSQTNREQIAAWLASCGISVQNEERKMRASGHTPSGVVPNARMEVPAPVFVPLLTVAQAATIGANCRGPEIIEDGAESGFMHPQPEDFAILVSGTSMMPWYPPGTQLLVGKGERPRTGDRVAAMLADYEEPVFKVFIDRGETFELLSINQQDGIPPIVLDKMDHSTWFWCWPIKESKRDERALDAAMREFGINHFWEKLS